MKTQEYTGGFPPIPKELVEHLERNHPPVLFNPKEPPDQQFALHAFNSGARAVVALLRLHYEKQNEPELED